MKINFSSKWSVPNLVEVDKPYWFAQVSLGSKGTRFERRTKPMKVFWRGGNYNYNWDLSSNKEYEKKINSQHMISEPYYGGALFDNEEECIEWYNNQIKECIRGLDGLKHRYAESSLDVTRRNWAKYLIGEKMKFDDPIYSQTINMKRAIEFVRFYNSQQSIAESEISLIKDFLSKKTSK